MSLLHPSNMPVFRLKDRKVKTWSFNEGYTWNIHCSLPQCQAHPLHLRENIAFSEVANKHMHRSWDTEAILFSVGSWWIRIMSFHFIKIGNDTLFGRWWNWKDNWSARYVMWDYACSCFNKYHTKARFIYMTRGGGEACIYIKQITTKKSYVHWILIYLKLNILDCACASTSGMCARFH
jgi:hypothetical protein